MTQDKPTEFMYIHVCGWSLDTAYMYIVHCIYRGKVFNLVIWQIAHTYLNVHCTLYMYMSDAKSNNKR